MALFLSTVTNKIDRKGRISVPAPFRAVLIEQGWAGFVAYPSFVQPAIEACDLGYMEKLSAGIDVFAPYTDEHQAFATAILASSHQLPFDSEGRVSLPQELIDHCEISERATFVGRGHTFQIWQPEAFSRHYADARKIAHEQRATLHWQINPGQSNPGQSNPGEKL